MLSSVPNLNQTGYAAATQLPTSDSISLRGLGSGSREGHQPRPGEWMAYPSTSLSFVMLGNCFPLDDAERIQIVRGGEGALLGNYAEGGWRELHLADRQAG